MVQSARSRSVLTLYSTADDIQCHRARLVLAAKGVSYERVLVDPSKPPEDLVDLNPYGTTPTLVDRDLTLYGTSVVCEYLDERYPHPPLMPIDPLSRAPAFGDPADRAGLVARGRYHPCRWPPGRCGTQAFA